MKKVEILTSKDQPENWFDTITKECMDYPIDKMNINKNGKVIDVGSNVGGFINAWGHICDNWTLVEPSSYNCQEIKKNIKNKNYTILKKAAHKESNAILKLQKYIDPNNNNETTSGNFGVTEFIYTNNKHGWQGDFEEVISISIDDLLIDESVELLKIDCEGSEYDFLINKDLSKIKYIVLELHNFLGIGKQKELCEWINKTHGEIYSMGDGVNTHFIKAWEILKK